jgi:lysozyme family protein
LFEATSLVGLFTTEIEKIFPRSYWNGVKQGLPSPPLAAHSMEVAILAGLSAVISVSRIEALC